MPNKKKLTNEEAVKLFWDYYLHYKDVKKAFNEMEKLYSFDKNAVINNVKQQAKQGETYLDKIPDAGKRVKVFELQDFKQPEQLDKNPKFIRKISNEEALKQIAKLKNDPQALLNFLKQHDFSSKKVWLDTIKKNPQAILELGEEEPSKGLGGKGKVSLNLDKAIDVYKELLRKHKGDFDKALEELYRDYDVKDKKAFETLVNYTKTKYQQSKNIKGQLPQGEEKSLVKAPQEQSLVKTPQQAKEKSSQTPKEEASQMPKEETSLTTKEKVPATTEIIKKPSWYDSVLEFAKRNKKWGAFILPVLGYGIYKGATSDKEQSSQPPTPPTQEQPTQQSAQPEQQQPEQQQMFSIPQAPDYSSEYSEELKQFQSQMLSLFQDLDKYRQLYDATLQQYTKANEVYEKQLLGILPEIPLLLAKTPLNNMTNEDLIQHTNQLFTMMPYEDALERVGNLTKGYYIAKMNGVDPKSLSTTDLLEISENPVLAKSSNENLAQFLSQVGEILKYKIKSNLDKIGAVKDAYELRLKELQEKGKIYNDVIKSIKDQYNFMLNEDKLNAMIQNWNIRDYLWGLSIQEKDKIAQMRAQENGKGNNKFNLFKFAESVDVSDCPKDPKNKNLPEMSCLANKLAGKQ
ncbi:MAG: hypothetical protein JHC31_05715 [Sulfurihydrogenibium sp.]|nr:hypothetical protein [Sulfurihydrogenibium sp.]